MIFLPLAGIHIDYHNLQLVARKKLQRAGLFGFREGYRLLDILSEFPDFRKAWGNQRRDIFAIHEGELNSSVLFPKKLDMNWEN